MGSKRKSKRRKKEAQTKLRREASQHSQTPWWVSKAAKPYRVSGLLMTTAGALFGGWLLTFSMADVVVVGQDVLWQWDQARLIGGYAAALIAMFLGWGSYKGELISRLAGSALLIGLAGGALVLALSHTNWLLLTGAAVIALGSLVLAYLLVLWAPSD